MFFKPAFYSVLEGDILQIVLQTNKQFEVPLTIDVTIVEGTAVGKCLAHILCKKQHTTGKALLIIILWYIRVCSGKEVLIYIYAYACTILLVLDDEWQKAPSLACLPLTLHCYLCDCALNSNTKVGAGAQDYKKYHTPMLY